MGMLQDQGAAVMSHAGLYGDHLGGGLFSEVFAMPGGKVVKVARCIDGTYWWLKYAHMLTLAGVSRPLVPVVYELVQVDYMGTPGYVAIMEQYDCARMHIAELGLPRFDIDWIEGTKEAKEQFHDWCDMCGLARVEFNDLHHGNVMLNGDEWVITDPSSSEGTGLQHDTTEHFLKGFYEH